jgi:hypothetical protein
MPQSRQALIAFLRAASRDTALLDYQKMMAEAADEMEAQDDERAADRPDQPPAP